MRLLRACVTTLLLAICSTVLGEVVTTVDGASFEGKVTGNDDFGVVVETASGTVTLPRDVVKSIRREGESDPTTLPSLKPGQRIPGWVTIVTELSVQPWATEFRQIPATVIDKGVMRNVPYQSYRCGGGDYELNIYGDPDDPAAIELGVYRGLLKDPEAKRRCIDFVASMMVERADGGVVRAVDTARDLITRNGLTVEVTPETAEDSYGGWWVSVYSESSLDRSRAPEDEMKSITVTTDGTAAAPTTRAAAAAPVAPSAPYALSPQVATAAPASGPIPTTPPDAWTAADMAYARPSAPPPSPSPSYSASYGGAGPKTVYVRGYTRKDGTYVHSYTRSAPGYGRSSGSHSGGHGGGRH